MNQGLYRRVDSQKSLIRSMHYQKLSIVLNEVYYPKHRAENTIVLMHWFGVYSGEQVNISRFCGHNLIRDKAKVHLRSTDLSADTNSCRCNMNSSWVNG